MPTIASIDVGSNAIRLSVANVDSNGEYRTVYNERAPVRLGQDVFTKGLISTHTIDRMLETFGEFRKKLEEHAVMRVKADRKSTRLNSSHGYISYAVFC